MAMARANGTSCLKGGLCAKDIPFLDTTVGKHSGGHLIQ